MAMSLGSGNNRFLVGLAIILAGSGVLAVVLWSTGRPDVTSGSEQQRAAAVVRIASQRPLGARDSLSTAAQDESPIVRRAAIVGLTQMAEAMNSENRPVIEKAVRDKDAGVRAVAAESLGKFNDAPATGELIRLLETDRDESVRKAALRGLVDCDDPRAIVTMVETAGNNASWVGWEWDIYCNWRITSDVSWTVRYGAFQPGGAFADQDGRQFLYTGISYNF